MKTNLPAFVARIEYHGNLCGNLQEHTYREEIYKELHYEHVLF